MENRNEPAPSTVHNALSSDRKDCRYEMLDIIMTMASEHTSACGQPRSHDLDLDRPGPTWTQYN